MAPESMNKDAFRGPPPPIAYASPVAVYQSRTLPLNLVALIISYIDDLGDLSRITRTSRLLYYMTLPRLYEKVTLRSYSELRYKDNGRPEGYGSGSPFSMGLNGLVTKNIAQYVHSWRLVGDWRESDVDDFMKGRVPDNSMMLNIAVRAAMDRMERLEAFSWELNTKPLQTIYSGLISCPTLRSLTLKFPSTRVPRPTVMIPPLPNLVEFKVFEIDPLCYPDDISLLLLHSKKLKSLHLHWSPRMRDAGEESTNLHAYFGRCLTSNYRLPLKKFSFINLYTRANVDLESLIDIEGLEEATFINCNTQDAMTVFVDDTWRMVEPRQVPRNLKMMRGDILDAKQAGVMSRLTGLERLYLVNAKRKASRSTPNQGISLSPNGNGFIPEIQSPPGGGADTPISRESASIAGDYLAAITRQLGGSLRHLLLSDQWLLGGEVLMALARACPQLEQLGLALEEKNPESMRTVLTYLPRLWALRILMRASPQELELMQSISGLLHEQVIAFELRRKEWNHIKWLGVGELVFECAGVRRVEGAGVGGSAAGGEGAAATAQENAQGDELGVRRVVKLVGKEAVKHVEIWSMDSADVY